MRNPWKRPAAPAPAFSIYGPAALGIDETGRGCSLVLMYRQMLLAGEPGAGKSGGLNNLVAHAALSNDCRLWLMDGKRVELGLWRDVAEVFVGPDLGEAIDALTKLQAEMDRRYEFLESARRRKVVAEDRIDAIMLVIDELAYYSATTGLKKDRETFSILLRDLVARGRAAGVIVIAATQRPSSDIIPTSLRDLFGYRLAFRCTTDTSSDIILGHGWAGRGYDASLIDPADAGAGGCWPRAVSRSGSGAPTCRMPTSRPSSPRSPEGRRDGPPEPPKWPARAAAGRATWAALPLQPARPGPRAVPPRRDR